MLSSGVCHVRRRIVPTFLLGILALGLLSPPLAAQRRRFGARPQSSAASLLLAGGGSYAMSDLEIVPGTDQNGGWAWDAGLRLQRGRGALGIGYERLRLDVGPDGTATASGIFVEPRLSWGGGMGGVRPYVFAHGSRIFDYDVSSFCCNIYQASSTARGWLVGAGFGVTTAPVGHVRFDLNAAVNRLSGKSPTVNLGSWDSAGPLVDLRLGAAVPLIGGWR
jgi:hypothetical protein